MEELLQKSLKIKDKTYELEKEFYRAKSKLEDERKEVIQEMINIKLKELGVSIGDKVTDGKENVAFLVDVDFRQKPLTIFKEEEFTLEDFEFKGEYKAVKQDGTISKKEPIMSLDFNSLKKIA